MQWVWLRMTIAIVIRVTLVACRWSLLSAFCSYPRQEWNVLKFACAFTVMEQAVMEFCATKKNTQKKNIKHK